MEHSRPAGNITAGGRERTRVPFVPGPHGNIPGRREYSRPTGNIPGRREYSRPLGGYSRPAVVQVAHLLYLLCYRWFLPTRLPVAHLLCLLCTGGAYLLWYRWRTSYTYYAQVVPTYYGTGGAPPIPTMLQVVPTYSGTGGAPPYLLCYRWRTSYTYYATGGSNLLGYRWRTSYTYFATGGAYLLWYR